MLTDRFHRVQDYLRISLTQACNLRCGYCIPAGSPECFPVKEELMTAEEIAALGKSFDGLGIKKIRLTGGEPLLRKDFGKIISLLRSHVGNATEIALTTNGVLLHRYLDALKEANVRSVNVSLDTLMPERFAQITRRDFFHQVLSNIHLLLQNKFSVKVNAVIIKNFNDDELFDFVHWTRDYPVDVRFIEFMPFRGNGWGKEKLVSMQEMLARITHDFDAVKLAGEKNETSVTYKVPGFEGTFSFIPTMSAPFCEGCSRLRMTADGKLRNCLFSKEETDLLKILRSGGDVENAIRQSVLEKKEKWGGRQLHEETVQRSMVSIGG